MVKKEEVILSILIILTASTALILPNLLFWSFSILLGIFVISKLQLSNLHEEDRLYYFSFILSLLLFMAVFLIENPNVSTAVAFLSIFWFIRGAISFKNRMELQKTEEISTEVHINNVIQNKENNYQEFTEALLKQMDTKMKYIVNGLGDIQFKINTLEGENKKDFEKEMREELYNDLVLEIREVKEKKENQINYKEIERIIDNKLNVLSENISQFKEVNENGTQSNSNQMEEVFEVLINSFKDLKETQQSQMSQVEEIYGLFKNEKISFTKINKIIAEQVTVCAGFTEESIDSLITAITLENLTGSTLDAMSYNGLTNHYTGVFEQEMRRIIGMHGKRSNNMNKKIMWNDICKYLKSNQIPILSENIPNIYGYMAEIHPIRNKIAHGEPIKKEEFEIVKNFALDKKIFYFMSQTLMKIK